MARGQRVDIGDLVYHIINRSNGRLKMFETNAMYVDFEELLQEGMERYNMRILAYVVMPNHWRLLLHPRLDGDLSRFMQWLGNTHTRRFHAQTKTIGSGHLYQGRYKSFLVEDDIHLLTVLKYIERNPVRAHLVDVAESWKWGSAHRRIKGTPKQQSLLVDSPAPLPKDYRFWINANDKIDDLTIVRQSVLKGVPYGGDLWREHMISTYNLLQTTRHPGRPKNGD